VGHRGPEQVGGADAAGEEGEMMKGRIVDLSHKLYPGKEEYHLELDTHFTDELYPQYKRDRDVWYILQDIRMSSHCGTHIEFPYHHSRHGLDAGSFPLERLIGDALLLDFTRKKPFEAVTLEELTAFDGRIREKDMLLFNFDCARRYRTESSHERPYITREAVRWLALEKKVGLVGSDASGIEVKCEPNQPNHQLLMDNGIPVIEFAANLERLRKERFTLVILPLCVAGLDSCPVRLIAVEEEGEAE
jgi:arylformamidase